jgi:hypothetical protein
MRLLAWVPTCGPFDRADMGTEVTSAQRYWIARTPLDCLKDCRDSLTSADTLGGEGIALAFAPENLRRFRGNAGTGGAQWMAD